MLKDAYNSKRLILLLDGLDEAPELTQDMQSFIFHKLIPACHRFIVTARPEISPPFVEEGFTILGMQGYTEEHQRNLLRDQLDGDSAVFMNNLLDHVQAITLQDTQYALLKHADTAQIEKIHAFDKTKLKNGTYDNTFKQVSSSSSSTSSSSSS